MSLKLFVALSVDLVFNADLTIDKNVLSMLIKYLLLRLLNYQDIFFCNGWNMGVCGAYCLLSITH